MLTIQRSPEEVDTVDESDENDDTSQPDVFDPDAERVGELMSLLDSTSLPSSATWLSDRGFRSTGRDCHHCPNGTLWFAGHEVVCDRCSTVGDMEEKRSSSRTADPWTVFNELRADGRYDYRSNKKRCVGGFSWTYDWVSRDDLDHDQAVADVDPAEFYR